MLPLLKYGHDLFDEVARLVSGVLMSLFVLIHKASTTHQRKENMRPFLQAELHARN